MKIEKNSIYLSDAKSLIKKMIKQNILVDLILTDPPYNISRNNQFNTMGRSGIDFGEWDKNFDQTNWLKNIAKILTDNGSIIIFNDWKNMGMISAKLEKEGFEVKDLLRWIKPAPMPRNTERRYVTDFEFAIWATKKNAKWIFNKDKDLPYLRPEFSKISPPMGKKRMHPTQKPIELIEQIIEIHSNKGDIIFDPFSGSGAISMAAINLGRYYIGGDINEKYVNISNDLLRKQYIRPAFNHLGNKSRMIDSLIKNFPNKNVIHFVEPFAGSGIVSVSYKNPTKYWLNDLDKNLIDILDLLLNTDKTLIINDLEKTIRKYNLPMDKKIDYKNQYNKLKRDYNNKKDVIKLFVLVLFGFNQQIRFNKEGEFNIPAGKFYWNNYHKEKIIKFIENKENKKYQISSKDFEEFLNDLIKSGKINMDNSFIYFDPPYFLSDATYNSNWTKYEEERLIKYLKYLSNNGYKWCLSNVIKSKTHNNDYLMNFINNGKNIKYKIIENISYSNSNYQRKRTEFDDEEILIWSNYE
ncbi:MAG: Dam family site-specific DNA-(adenine-N6)-methyltransferase [Metamycoplasmataceae bacterium]